MAQNELKILLTSGSPSIMFDARGASAASGSHREPFFKLRFLRNAIVFKTGEDGAGLRTILYMPFDSNNPARGGVSMECLPQMDRRDIEGFLGVNPDREHVDEDLRKIQILASAPCFAPFLLRDAFERARMKVDLRHFQVSDEEVLGMKDNLKAKLKPLAAMALPGSGGNVQQAHLDLLVNKLWDLNDPAFLDVFGRSLRIPAGETVKTLYAWLGVSYLNREFTKRQGLLRTLGQWLVTKHPFPPNTREDIVAQYEADRLRIREGLRVTWSSACAVFESFNESYDSLIEESDPALFIKYLTYARNDFEQLGHYFTMIELAFCLYAAISREPKGSALSEQLLRSMSAAMRGMGEKRAA
jgi:hypothetical protein